MICIESSASSGADCSRLVAKIVELIILTRYDQRERERAMQQNFLYLYFLLVATTFNGSLSFAARETVGTQISIGKYLISDCEGIHNNPNTQRTRVSKTAAFQPWGCSLKRCACQKTANRRTYWQGLQVAGGSSVAYEADGFNSSWQRQQKQRMGRSILLLVACLYGTLNVCLRRVYTLDIPPTAPAVSATRGILAALCFAHVPFQRNGGRHITDDDTKKETQSRFDSMETPSTSTSLKRPTRRLLWFTAFDLAFWNFLAQGLITLGLVYCPSARASFLTQSSVIFTPLLSFGAGHKISSPVWCGAGLAFMGLCILSSSGGEGGMAAVSTHMKMKTTTGIAGTIWQWLHSIHPGDGLVLVGALSWSIYLVRLARASSSKNNKYGIDFPTLPLQAIKTLLLAIMYTCWWMLHSWIAKTRTATTSAMGTNAAWWTSGTAWFWLVISAIGPGALADVLQQKGQQHVSPAETNIILSSEPVFTAVFGLLLLGERVAAREMTGGAIILLAAALSSLSA